MAPRYFMLSDEERAADGWGLGDPRDAQGRELGDSFQFTRGAPVPAEGRFKVPVVQPGRPLGFCLAGVGSTPIAHPKVASVFTELAPDDVQLLKAEVDGQAEPYHIVVATRTLACIDERASGPATRWGLTDGHPNRVGHYRSLRDPRVNPVLASKARVFRLTGWTVALLVSDDLRQALERAGVERTWFQEVTVPSPAPPSAAPPGAARR